MVLNTSPKHQNPQSEMTGGFCVPDTAEPNPTNTAPTANLIQPPFPDTPRDRHRSRRHRTRSTGDRTGHKTSAQTTISAQPNASDRGFAQQLTAAMGTGEGEAFVP